MRPDAAEADRRREVRQAARGWRRASAIDEATLAAVVAAYPDDRARLGPAFRVLAFIFTFLALNAGFFLVAAVVEPRQAAGCTLALLFGIALCILTEVQTGPLKRDGGGTEAATAFAALCYLIGAAWCLLDEAGLAERTLIPWLFALAAVLLLAGAWRWGQTIFAAGATCSFFLLLAQSPAGRLLWVAAALVLIVPLLRAVDSPHWPPTHRRSAQVALALSLVALYAALNLASWDHAAIESLKTSNADHELDGRLRPLAVMGTALIPAAMIAFGVRSRRRLFLDLGFVLGVASLVTLRAYVHVAALWLVLSLGGGAAIALALAVRRALARGPHGERGGFTAEPLFEDLSRQGALEAAASLAAAPGARRVSAEAAPALKPGGGRFGGGGATGEY